MFYNDTWGTVCDDNIRSLQLANIVCRTQNFSRALCNVNAARYGPGLGEQGVGFGEGLGEQRVGLGEQGAGLRKQGVNRGRGCVGRGWGSVMRIPISLALMPRDVTYSHACAAAIQLPTHIPLQAPSGWTTWRVTGLLSCWKTAASLDGVCITVTTSQMTSP